MRVLEAMKKAMQQPGVEFTDGVVTVSYKENEHQLSTWNFKSDRQITQLNNNAGYKRKTPDIKVGQWYVGDTNLHLKIMHIEETTGHILTIEVGEDQSNRKKWMQLCDGDESHKEHLRDWYQLITDEYEIMFLEHSRLPHTFEKGDIYTFNGGPVEVNNTKRITDKIKLICFREHRADWKESK